MDSVYYNSNSWTSYCIYSFWTEKWITQLHAVIGSIFEQFSAFSPMMKIDQYDSIILATVTWNDAPTDDVSGIVLAHRVQRMEKHYIIVFLNFDDVTHHRSDWLPDVISLIFNLTARGQAPAPPEVSTVVSQHAGWGFKSTEGQSLGVDVVRRAWRSRMCCSERCLFVPKSLLTGVAAESSFVNDVTRVWTHRRVCYRIHLIDTTDRLFSVTQPTERTAAAAAAAGLKHSLAVRGWDRTQLPSGLGWCRWTRAACSALSSWRGWCKRRS